MPSHGLVDVQVLVDDQALEEYLDQQHHDSTDENELVRYVKAGAGQRFIAKVTWKRGFVINDSPYLYARLLVDGEERGVHASVACKNLRLLDGALAEPCEKLLASRRAKTQDGEWKRAHYVFGALGLDEGVSKVDMTPVQALGLGTIEVKVCRAKKVLRQRPWTSDGVLPAVRDKIPEEALKGRDIKTNVKFAMTDEATSGPRTHNFDYVPTEAVTKVVFKYRTKKALQNLDCIPRSPSPEPDYKLVSARQEKMLQELKRQLHESKAAYEREVNRSRNTSAILAGDPSQSPSSASRKRGREDNDDLMELDSPPKKQVIGIDLTEDD